MPIPGVVTQAAGIGMGLLLEKHNDRRQREQQEALNRIQQGYDKKMTDYQYETQMKMWNNTNYGAQMAHLKAAGLNPGLIYGMGGAGGATTGGGAASSHGANAPGITGESISMGGMGIQAAMLQAQIENIKADTEKKKTEAGYTAGVGTELGHATIADIKQGIQNKEAQEGLTKIETSLKWMEYGIQGDTYDDQVRTVKQGVSKLIKEVELLSNQKTISDATMKDTIDIVRLEALKKAVEITYTKQQIQKSQAEISEIANRITMSWKQLGLDNIKAAIDTYNSETNRINARTGQTHQLQQEDKMIADIIGMIFGGIGVGAGMGSKMRTPIQGFSPGRKY